jgi:hypothetical protein
MCGWIIIMCQEMSVLCRAEHRSPTRSAGRGFGLLARRRPGFESSAGTASIHLDVYPQRREHSWDGYVRYIKVII